jgi:hypothetical protein
MKKYFVARITEGCTAYNFSVDGVSWLCEDKRYEVADKTKEEFKIALAQFIHNQIISEEIDMQSALKILETSNEHWDSNICDQCGDTVSWEEWKIPK